MRVLTLAQNYEPIGVISWEKAVTLLIDKKVNVLETYERDVRSAHLSMKMPSVVIFNYSKGRGKRAIRFSRKNVWLRDEGKCQYCSKNLSIANYTLDHVKPKCFGGISSWDNVVTCCYECNQKKGERTLQRSGMKLLNKPVKPVYLPFVATFLEYYSKDKMMPDNWKFWIGNQ
jgi:5-methylcytosine-specific restriction endonuclease McrA